MEWNYHLRVWKLILLHLTMILLATHNSIISEVAGAAKDSKNKSNIMIVTETFADWNLWTKKYSLCNPTENPNTSPIRINKDDSTPNNDIKPIVVHGTGPSHHCLFLSTIYKQELLEVEVVNIQPSPECRTSVTYIGGAGEGVMSKRYFRKALLLFTNSDVSMPQSLHQIDGKKFQMEVAMEFQDLLSQRSTEIHVLVEAKAPGETPENPIFKPLEKAIIDLKKEIVSEATGTSEVGKRFKNLRDSCLNHQKNYSAAESKESELKTYRERINRLESILRDINGITNLEYMELIVKEYDTLINGPLNNTIEYFEEKLEKLRKKKVHLTRQLSYYNSDKDVRKMLFETTGNLLYFTKQLVNAKEGKSPNLEISPQMKLKNLKAALKRNKVGIPDEKPYLGQIYDSPDDVYEELERVRRKYHAMLELKRKQKGACIELENLKKFGTHGTVPIEMPFQISWFFPLTGGYYLYDGSSPIPKCERRQHTIVFEKPIQMTTEQLAVFQSLPSLSALKKAVEGGKSFDANAQDFDANMKVDKMIPVIYDKSKRMVKFIKKKAVFLGDDALHRKAKRRNISDESLMNEVSSGRKCGMEDGMLLIVFIQLISMTLY